MRNIAIFAILLILVVLLLPVGINVLASDSNAIVTASVDQAQIIIKDFVSVNPLRLYDSKGEYDASIWIYDAFVQLGVEVSYQQIDNANYSRNVVATIDVDNSDNVIIIGAHYDNAYGSGQGATDNGSGVTAMLMIAQEIVEHQHMLQCDIQFVAFAGEEVGLVGSSYFVNSMSIAQRELVRLMINIDTIAMGDNLMILGENKRTDYVDALIRGASKSMQNIAYKPLTAGLNYNADMYGYGYYDNMQNSDHTPFRLSGIPTAFYFSGTFDTFGRVYAESVNEDNRIIHTDRDTIDVISNNGESTRYAENIVTVVYSVCNSILSEDVALLLDAPSQLVPSAWYNSVYAKLASGVIVLIVATMAVLHWKKLEKQSILGSTQSASSKKLFAKPDSEDIFDLGDYR